MSSQAVAGAWPMPAGKGQIITTTVTDNASRGFDDQWKLTQDVSFSKFETQFYWEHGLSRKLTFVASTAYQDIDFTSRKGEETVEGFGNSTLGARYQFYESLKTVGSVQVKAIIAGNGEVIADADLGRGGNGLEIRGLLGRNFKLLNRDGFLDVQSAWIYRPSGSPQTFKSDATIGWNLTAKRQVVGQVFYAQTGAQILNNDRVLPNEFLKAQLSVVIKRSAKTSAQFGVFQTMTGRNIVQEKGIFAAVWRLY